MISAQAGAIGAAFRTAPNSFRSISCINAKSTKRPAAIARMDHSKGAWATMSNSSANETMEPSDACYAELSEPGEPLKHDPVNMRNRGNRCRDAPKNEDEANIVISPAKDFTLEKRPSEPKCYDVENAGRSHTPPADARKRPHRVPFPGCGKARKFGCATRSHACFIKPKGRKSISPACKTPTAAAPNAPPTMKT